MFDPFDQFARPDWVTWFEYAGIVAGALIPLSLVFRRVRQLASRWLIQPLTSRLFVGESLAKLCEELAGLRKELAEMRSENRESAAKIDAMAERVDTMQAVVWTIADANPALALFECDAHGTLVHVNATLARWMGESRTDMIGRDLAGCIAREDRERFRADLAVAFERHHEYRDIVRMGPFGAASVAYELTMKPIPDTRPVRLWIGSVEAYQGRVDAADHGRTGTGR